MRRMAGVPWLVSELRLQYKPETPRQEGVPVLSRDKFSRKSPAQLSRGQPVVPADAAGSVRKQLWKCWRKQAHKPLVRACRALAEWARWIL